METKSRYEVVMDLESKKRDLIKQRDELELEVKTKERNILNFKISSEDLSEIKKRQDFDFEKKQNELLVQRKEQELQMENTVEDRKRKIVDAEEDLKNFVLALPIRKANIEDQINSLNESLDRMTKLQEKK